MVSHFFEMVNGDWVDQPTTHLLKDELMYAEKDMPTELHATADKRKLELWYRDDDIPANKRDEFERKTAQMALTFLAKHARSTRKNNVLLSYKYKFESTN